MQKQQVKPKRFPPTTREEMAQLESELTAHLKQRFKLHNAGDVANDAIDDALVYFMSKLKKKEEEVRDFHALTFTIGRRRGSKEQLRQLDQIPMSPTLEDMIAEGRMFSGYRQTPTANDAEFLEEALAVLSRRERICVLARWFDQMSIVEIASMQKISETSARNAYNAGLAKLRAEILRLSKKEDDIVS